MIDKRKKLPKKTERLLKDIAENIYMQTQIDRWDGKEMRVWRDDQAIVGLKPKRKGEIEADTWVDFKIISHSRKKAREMFNEADEVFKGSECKIRWDDSSESQDITISCNDKRSFDTDESPKRIADKINDFVLDVKNDNREYVRHIKKMDESSDSDIDE